MSVPIVEVILGAKTLTASDPLRSGSGGGLEDSLRARRKAFEAWKVRSGNQELSRILHRLKTSHNLDPPPGFQTPIYWDTTADALCLLLLLEEVLQRLRELDLKDTTTPPLPPPLPPPPRALLSVADEGVLQSLFQFVVSLGIYPYLLPGVDAWLKLRIPHSDFIAKETTLPRSWFLLKCCQVLTRCCDDPLIGASLLSRHFSDILAALLQLCYSPSGDNSKTHDVFSQETSNKRTTSPPTCLSPSDIGPSSCSSTTDSRQSSEDLNFLTVTQQEWCVATLKELLSRVYQPLVVKELLVLQGMPLQTPSAAAAIPQPSSSQMSGSPQQTVRRSGGRVRSPKWLQRACGELLSECLMRRNGVQHVLRGIFEATSVSGPGGQPLGGGCEGGVSASDWRKCQAVARIIASCPAQASSVEEYYAIVCPQVLALFDLPVEGVGRHFLRVAVATVSTMLTQQRGLAVRYLFNAMAAVLISLSSGEMCEEDLETTVESLSRCMHTLHKVCGVLQASSPLTSELRPFLPVIFEVWRVGRRHELSLSLQAREVVSSLLKPADESLQMSFLKLLSSLPQPPPSAPQFLSLNPRLELVYHPLVSNLVLRLRSRKEEEEDGRQSLGVDKMESVTDCILELLRSDLKACELTAKFFLECLKHLASVLCEATGYRPSSRKSDSIKTTSLRAGTSSALLESEASPSGDTGRAALVLYLVAALCEDAELVVTILEQISLPGLFAVAATIIGCHAHSVVAETLTETKTSPPSSSSSSSSSSGGIRLRVVVVGAGANGELPGGTVSLSVVFGLLSAVLGGGREVERSDRPLLSSLLPPLELLSSGQGYPPDEGLSLLAGDLRVCITTLGAVWSAEMETRARGLLGGKTGDRQVSRNAAAAQDHKEEREHRVHKAQSTLPREQTAGIAETAPQEPTFRSGSGDGSFQQAMEDLADPLLPVQGHGLLSLARLARDGDQETLARSSQLLAIFRESLQHSDSYIYLAAINGLVALAHAKPDETIAILCQEYGQFLGPPQREAGRSFDKTTGQLSGPSQWGRDSVDKTTSVGKSESHRTMESSRMGQEGGGGGRRRRSVELRLKLGEALVRAVRDCGELLPRHMEQVFAAVLSNVRHEESLVRASALSNLADVCALLPHSFALVQHEVISCVTDVLKTEKDDRVCQAALVVLSHILQSVVSLSSLDGLAGCLKDVYRLLKLVAGDGGRSDLTRTHAEAAMGQLDTTMRQLLFPEQTLSKKISILDRP